MKFRKALRSFVALLMIFPLVAVPFSYASESVEFTKESAPISTFYTSEYEMYEALVATPTDELLTAGYSADVVRSIKRTSYETLLRERAALDVGTLTDYGYTQEQISLLKALDRNDISYSANLAAAVTSGCSGTLGIGDGTGRNEDDKSKISNREVTFYYKWEWTSAPVFQGIDSVAMSWEGHGAYNALDVLLRSTSGTAEFWLGSTKLYSTNLTRNNEASFSGVKYDFYVYDTTGVENAWLKKGKIVNTVYLSPTTIPNLAYLNACGTYGHTMLGMGIPSISAGSGPDSWAASFTPSISVDNLAMEMYALYTDGSKVDISGRNK